MPGEFDPLVKCPRCGASTLVDEHGSRWCSYIGGDTDAPCSWGLGSHDRGSREADRAAWRKKRGIPDPCPSGHPAACITSSAEGTAYCRWCNDIARIEASAHEHHRGLVARVGDVLGDNGCDCDCGHHPEEHDDDCERCLACRIDAALAEREVKP